MKSNQQKEQVRKDGMIRDIFRLISGKRSIADEVYQDLLIEEIKDDLDRFCLESKIENLKTRNLLLECRIKYLESIIKSKEQQRKVESV